MNGIRSIILAVAFSAAAAAAVAAESVVVDTTISEAEVRAAQDAWGAALVQISSDYRSGGHARAAATAAQVIDAAYGYGFGAVLFKPTLASGAQTFRVTRDGALSYFVGGDPAFPDDAGFALKNWTSYEIRNAGIFISGELALTMGNVVFTDQDGAVTMVDKTWGFKKDDAGALRIVLHHSSLPYSP
jgi:hypothetical protein